MSFLELLLYPPCFLSDVCLIRLIILIYYYFKSSPIYNDDHQPECNSTVKGRCIMGGKIVLDLTGHLSCFIV